MERLERAVGDGARVVDLDEDRESTLADITQQIIECQKAANNTLESSRKLLAKLHIYDSMASIKLGGSAKLGKTSTPEDFIVSLCEILRPNQAIVDEIDLEQDPFKGLLPTPNLDVFKSSASIALGAIRDSLTEELMASNGEIRNKVVIAIATHSDPLADWFDEENAKVCDSVRETYAPHVESKDVLVEYILKSIVKPVFGKGPRTITEQGRKAMRVPQARPEVFSFSDEKPWRKDKPEALSLLLFAIANLKHESVEQNWHLIVPPILTTLDEGDVLSKSHACGILERVIASVGSDFLNRTGLGSVFEEAISPCLHFLPPITPVNHSIKSFRAAVATSVALSKHRYSGPDEGMWYKALDKILRGGPFYGMTYAGENVSMVELFLQETKTLVKLLGVRSVRHLSKLVPLCTAQLVSPFIMTHPRLGHQAAETLIEVIRNCWPKIPEYNAEILKGVVFCWMRIKDEEKADSAVNLLKNELKVVMVVLEHVNRGSTTWFEEAKTAIMDREAGLEGLFGLISSTEAGSPMAR
ncbi:hypothetical protein H072_10467 [Dactylellina haptotyla CBS 200.50]|uniref:Uncharacterized protein n=1 Tax=Dactylellina haptotyla (strain CBS 200.50) TaxID=1284197 RepID=S8BAE1_DACHA|nr:hypothetical protein H072_10467 [Dactylellina haptotyla CBS 200.50]